MQQFMIGEILSQVDSATLALILQDYLISKMVNRFLRQYILETDSQIHNTEKDSYNVETLPHEG